ncbi:hypothetical protein [Pelagibacterium lacus]|nr:hypothetical protein [Pelagibacterium lacus]
MRALDDALRDIRREEDDITRRIARTNERIGKLRETELTHLRDLARIRLDPETQAQLSGTLSRAEEQARTMLKSHAAAMAENEKALAEKEATLTRLSREREERLAEAGSAQAQIDALAEAVEAGLGADAEFRALTTSFAESETIAIEADRKADKAEADREEKGRPYREDPLFLYLWERGYATPDYKAGNITRLLDNWVARLVDFHKARPNYAMLNAIPERLREHADRVEADVVAIETAMADRRRAALDQAGGKPARETLEAASARLTAIDAEILAIEDERDTLTAEQKRLADGTDPAFGEAVEVLSGAIRDTDVERLIADARATRTPEDDAIVARLQDSRRRMAEEQSELEEERTRLKTLESRRRELEDIEFEFKRSRYDDPRSRFGDEKLVGDFLTDFLKGGMTAATYWDKWHQSQDWSGTSGPIVPSSRPSASRKSGGGFTLPPGGFSPRPSSGGGRGGFSRPRSGGFGGKGFKTGGGFGGKGGGFKTGGGF